VVVVWLSLFVKVQHGSIGMDLDAIAAEICENLGSPALSLEREWLSPSGWHFLFRPGRGAVKERPITFPYPVRKLAARPF